jgi:hypothetical protein
MVTIRGERSTYADDDASASERSERETTPAPPSASSASSEELESLSSARPTSVPDYDVAAIAFESSLRHERLPSLPLDLAVPERTQEAPPDDLDLRASFLLLHIDGRSSVREISDLTSISVDEVLAAFLALAAKGLVELRGNQVARDVPISGERRRTESGTSQTLRVRTGS